MPTLIVKEPKAIIMDLIGTAVKMGFIEKILIPYVKANINSYLKDNWSDKKLQKDIEKLRKDQPKGDPSLTIAGKDADEATQQQSIANYFLKSMEAKKETSGIQQFRFGLWFDAYKKKKITTPIYSDVAIQVKKWKDNGIKLYVLSNGWKEANKKFLSATSHGDLNLMIDNHFDSSEGPLDSKDTYTKLLAKIKHSAEETLFLTKSGVEGLAAKEAGLSVVLVLTHRKNIEKLTDEEKAVPRVRTFNELEFGDVPTATPSPEGVETTQQGSGEAEAAPQ